MLVEVHYVSGVKERYDLSEKQVVELLEHVDDGEIYAFDQHHDKFYLNTVNVTHVRTGGRAAE